MALPPLVEPVDALSSAEAVRTARHQVLTGLGELGQRRLRAAHVAVVGAGGLGGAVVLALAAAGIGTLTVIDDDMVELSNLQRQVMHRHADLGAAKVDSAVRTAADLCPETVVHPVRTRLTHDNGAALLAGADVVVDGTDTFASRWDVADATETLGVPLVWGAIQQFTAQVTVFWASPPPGTPPVVLSDLHPRGDLSEVLACADVGVFGALCLQIGAVQAMEAIKLIAGIGDPLIGRVAVIDALRATSREVPLRAAQPPAGAAS
ncbi:ThiF family adenylyltransferase [Microbacterium esteraromaticum]|uniref:HesA/MoeB/ThiF family protein n=1 Tax=Microbacterium esteraromaticum TaxID=57043 RepID=UPI0023688AD5|nr:ThiF family adenylyltransferase [Microbacterium esteraromaticum]WDH78473.1 ThiF family adenylyltransferase [Microbacterium esteraromaticum]